MFPSRLRSLAFPHAFDNRNTLSPSDTAEFHLHPHYRSQTSLDAAVVKTQSGLDEFVTEKYQDQIAAIFDQWSAGLLRSPTDTRAVETILTSDFLGSSLRPVESRLVRSSAMLEIRQNKFRDEIPLGRNAFIQDLQSAMSFFSQIVTAEFQVVGISAIPSNASTAQGLPAGLRTRVRYEIVGSGRDFHRGQRVGYWELDWKATPAGSFQLKAWRALDETQSHAANPIYIDIAAQAFGSNSSFTSQLQRGSDYWRTLLDGACGIDIYGHNGVSVGDIDGDGFDDLYICQPAGLPNRLYRNRGDGTFEDITEKSGVGILENTACALFADIDNDGRQDLIVVRTSGPLLFLNEGDGSFASGPAHFNLRIPRKALSQAQPSPITIATDG